MNIIAFKSIAGRERIERLREELAASRHSPDQLSQLRQKLLAMRNNPEQLKQLRQSLLAGKPILAKEEKKEGEEKQVAKQHPLKPDQKPPPLIMMRDRGQFFREHQLPGHTRGGEHPLAGHRDQLSVASSNVNPGPPRLHRRPPFAGPAGAGREEEEGREGAAGGQRRVGEGGFRRGGPAGGGMFGRAGGFLEGISRLGGGGPPQQPPLPGRPFPRRRFRGPPTALKFRQVTSSSG